MVDFNNEVTIGTPSVDIVRVLLLQARANVLEALEHYNIKISQGVEADQSHIKARIGTWFLEHQAYLERTMKTKDYTEFKKSLDSFFFNQNELETKDILQIINELNTIMDNLRIIRIDLKKKYDKSDIEKDNSENDLR